MLNDVKNFVIDNAMNFKRPEICILIGVGVVSAILTQVIGGLLAIVTMICLLTLFGDRITQSIVTMVKTYYGEDMGSVEDEFEE